MSEKSNVASLTGLRGVAAMSILILHATAWCIPFTDAQALAITGEIIGTYGMPLFFVLSGFVIHYNYGVLFGGQPYGVALHQFFAARFARIYPLFFFFFVFGAIVDFTSNWIGYAPRTFLSYMFHFATLTQSWVYKIAIHERLLLDHGFGLSWSLSSEFFFYLAYTVLVFLILRLRRAATAAIAVILFSITAVSVLFTLYMHYDIVSDLARAHLNSYFSVEENWNASFYRWFFYYSPYVRIWEFMLGCLAAQLYIVLQHRQQTTTERRCAFGATCFALGFLLAFGLIHGIGSGNGAIDGVVRFFALNFGCALPLAIVIFCAARYKTAMSIFLSSPWMVFLGDISYSIYAVHTWTLRPLIRPPIGWNAIYAMDALLRLSAGIAFTLIVATATYQIIEVPSRRYFRSLLGARPSRPTPAHPA